MEVGGSVLGMASTVHRGPKAEVLLLGDAMGRRCGVEWKARLAGTQESGLHTGQV